MLNEIILIVKNYTSKIRQSINDIKSYIFIIIIGSIMIATAIFFILLLLGGLDIKNFQIIVGSVISVIASYLLNLYITYYSKIRECKIEREKNKKSRLRMIKIRHSEDPLIRENIFKAYIKIYFES